MMFVTLAFLGCVAGGMATWSQGYPTSVHNMGTYTTTGGHNMGTYKTGGHNMGTYTTTGGHNMGTYKTGGHNMGTYTATGGHNMGTYTRGGHNMGTYTQYPNYPQPSFNSWYDSNSYQMNPSTQYSWNYPTGSMYGSDMSYNSMPLYATSWNSNPYHTPKQYSGGVPTYDMKATYPKMKHTATYPSTQPRYPVIVGNTHTVNMGGRGRGGVRSSGISYTMNQGSYKPPISKHHASW